MPCLQTSHCGNTLFTSHISDKRHPNSDTPQAMYASATQMEAIRPPNGAMDLVSVQLCRLSQSHPSTAEQNPHEVTACLQLSTLVVRGTCMSCICFFHLHSARHGLHQWPIAKLCFAFAKQRLNSSESNDTAPPHANEAAYSSLHRTAQPKHTSRVAV